MAKNMNFVPNFSVHDALGSQDAAQTPINADGIDVANYDCVAAIVRLGTITDTGVGTVRMQESDSESTGYTDVANTTVNFSRLSTATPAVNHSDNTVVVEIVKPTKRYARVRITRGAANSAISAAHYVLGGLRYTDGSPQFDHPATTHVASGVSGEDNDTHTSPGEAV